MRVLFALAILALGVAPFSAASAADLPAGRSAYTTHLVASGVRAPQILIYDDQPGVYVRAYWQAPWRNRHYFPRTGKAPNIGRREILSKGGAPKLAKTFYREWSTSSAIVGADVYYPEPATRDDPPRSNEPLK
jgi:hypothetical protein